MSQEPTPIEQPPMTEAEAADFLSKTAPHAEKLAELADELTSK